MINPVSVEQLIKQNKLMGKNTIKTEDIQNLRDKLDRVLQMLQQIHRINRGQELRSKQAGRQKQINVNKQNHIVKNRNYLGKYTAYRIRSNRTRFSKIQQIQKENDILMYQVNLLSTILNMLQIDESQEAYTIGKDHLNRQIELQQHIKQQEQKVWKLQKQNSQLLNFNRQMQKKIDAALRNKEMYQKRIQDIEKVCTKQKLCKLNQKIKQQESKIASLDRKQQESKQIIRQLQSKVKILQELNKQTQDKLSQALLKQVVCTKNNQSFLPNCKANINSQFFNNITKSSVQEKQKIKRSRLSNKIIKQKRDLKNIYEMKQNEKNKHNICKQIQKYSTNQIEQPIETNTMAINQYRDQVGSKKESEGNRIKLMAAKQEIRSLKNKIQQLIRQKEEIIKKSDQKQNLYSKLVMKNR